MRILALGLQGPWPCTCKRRKFQSSTRVLCSLCLHHAKHVSVLLAPENLTIADMYSGSPER